MSGDWTGRVTCGQGQAVAVVEIKEVRWMARAGEEAEEDTPQSGARERCLSDAYRAKMKRAQEAVRELNRVQTLERARELWKAWRRKRNAERACERESEEAVEKNRVGRPGVSSVV
jgi:Mg-chelatase subunit ChlD